MLGLKPVQVSFIDELQLLFADAFSFAFILISITEDSVGYCLRLYVSMYARAFQVTLK